MKVYETYEFKNDMPVGRLYRGSREAAVASAKSFIRNVRSGTYSGIRWDDGVSVRVEELYECGGEVEYGEEVIHIDAVEDNDKLLDKWPQH